MTELLDDLVLRFPARPGYLSISRLNATAMAAGAGFDVEELDDLRLAIDEAVSWLIPERPVEGAGEVEGAGAVEGAGEVEGVEATGAGSADGEDVVELSIRCRPGQLDVTGTRWGDSVVDVALDELVHAILGATVDHYETAHRRGVSRSITLVKRRPTDG